MRDQVAEVLSRDKAKRLVKLFKDEKSGRSNWETLWAQIAIFFAPDKDNIWNFLTMPGGEEKRAGVYDGTAEHVKELLASALHSMLTNPVSQWFSLTTGDPEVDKVIRVREWLQKLVRKMHEILNASNFQTEIHSLYLDLISFGTSNMRMLEDLEFLVRFQSRPIAEAYIRENEHGEVDTLMTEERMTVRQVIKKFGEDFLKDPSNHAFRKKLDAKIVVLHVVMPRGDAKLDKVDAGNKPFASYHILMETNTMLKESGFNEFPFLVPRWVKVPGEKYGRSPAMKSLPDVRMLNEIMKDTIRAAQKVTDPPLFLPDDGELGDVDFTPGGLNYYRSGSGDKIFPLATNGQPRIGFEIMDDLRARIKQAFFIDQLQLKDGPQMTATEVNVRDNENLRLLGPLLGRLQFELLAPLVGRLIGIMKRKGELPDDIPEELQDVNLQVFYSSEIARSQKIAEAQNLDRLTQTMAPLVEIAPEVVDNVNPDKWLKLAAILHNVPAEVFREEEEVKEIREGRAEQQQQAQEQEAAAMDAETASKQAQAVGQLG